MTTRKYSLERRPAIATICHNPTQKICKGFFFHIIVTVLLAALCGCNNPSGKGNTRELYIDHYKSECTGTTVGLCLRARESPEDEWVVLDGPIDGFEYEWGYSYKVQVIVEDLENPSEGTPSQRRTLITVRSKELALDTEYFDIAVNRTPAPGSIVQKSGNIYELHGEKEFYCTAHQSLFLTSLLAQDMAILIEFAHNSPPSEPMYLIQLKCSASRESFNGSCL
ncbi:MAG: DUF4377 domain-containing protein [Candidatus Thiodiazotropha sp.]